MSSKKNDKIKIAIISSQYFWLPEEKGPSRFYSIAKIFQDNGFDVEVITSSFGHHTKAQRNKNTKDNIDVIYIGCPAYKRNIDLKREISNIVFTYKIKNILLSNKYDVIYCSLPPNNISAVVGKYCKKNNIPFIVDIEDLWPEAMRMIINIPILSDIVFYPYKKAAESTYKYADGIVGTSEEYTKRAWKNNRRIIPNRTVYVGCDILKFDDEACSCLEKIEKPENEFWITYAGTIGHSYAIDNLVRVGKLLKRNNVKNVKIKILGSGSLKEEVENLAKTFGCDNVEFLGYVEHPVMSAYLVKSDIVVNSFAKGAPQSIVNKIGDYLAAGKPIINTLENKEFCSLVKKYKIGVNVPAENPNKFYEVLLELIGNKEKRDLMSINARCLAEQKFDRKVSYQEIINLIMEIIEQRKH